MKTIHLIRHAKSSWNHPDLSDMERPLNHRGRKACQTMAHHISHSGCSFEHVFCSVARRAQSTIEGIAAQLPEITISWQLDDDLYTFNWHNLLSWMHQQDDTLEEIVTIGHNPAITEFCNNMGNTYIPNVPTCGYAQITFPISNWTDLCPGSGKLVAFLTPKSVEEK